MSTAQPATLFADDHNILTDRGHILIAGASGSGKSVLQLKMGRANLRDPRFGVHQIDPDGGVAEDLFHFLANPANGLSWRKVHYLQPASPSETFGLSLLYVPDRTPQLCHEAALRKRPLTAAAVVDCGGSREG